MNRGLEKIEMRRTKSCQSKTCEKSEVCVVKCGVMWSGVVSVWPQGVAALSWDLEQRALCLQSINWQRVNCKSLVLPRQNIRSFMTDFFRSKLNLPILMFLIFHCKKLTHFIRINPSVWKSRGLLALVTLSLLKSSERKYIRMFSYADFAGKLDFAS